MTDFSSISFLGVFPNITAKTENQLFLVLSLIIFVIVEIMGKNKRIICNQQKSIDSPFMTLNSLEIKKGN